MRGILSRIQEIIRNEGITTGSMEKSIGASKGVLSRAITNGTDIQSKWIELLVENYPHYSAEWLLTGKGEMLKPDYGQPDMEITPINQSKSIEKKVDMQAINLYDFQASAGLKNVLENRQVNIVDTIYIPNLPKCDGGLYVIGDSMYPKIREGDIVLYREQTLEMQNIVYGKIYLLSYIIDGDDYTVIKYIRRSEQEEPYLSLESENPEHAPFELSFGCVTALALVRATIHVNRMV